MKIAYFDCFAGASGDMILGALVDAGVPQEVLKEKLTGLFLQNFSLNIRKVKKNGFSATKVDVIVHDDTPERHCSEILQMVEKSDLPEKVRSGALSVFRKLCEVEAKIHHANPEKVHLHELSGVDTIVDVVGTFSAMEYLRVEEVVVSPLPVGRGFVTGAHGKIPLPAPATLALLRDTPIYGVEVDEELVTPTGAALLTHMADRFGPFPSMSVEGVGYGAGSRDLPIPNLLRLVIGESQTVSQLKTEQLLLLEANIDDQNPELLAYVMEKLLKQGALDAFFTPIYMKKGRPAVLLSVLCEPVNGNDLENLIFQETSTLGVRHQWVERSCLPRKTITVKTALGNAQVKIAYLPNGKAKISPEFEDCKRLSEKGHLPLREIYEQVLHAAKSEINMRGEENR